MTTPETRHYDLIIIGTGTGNMLPGEEFGDTRIAIVERARFGGTCLNVGCIPTKMYVYAAELARAARESSRLGVDMTLDAVRWNDIVTRVFDNRIDLIAAGGEAYRRGPECPTIDVYDGSATFTGPKTLATADGDTPVTLTADRIIIAAGARPHIPQVIADSGIEYHTNEDILRLPELPHSMIVLGGGIIAAEFAHVFDAFGVEVTVINRSPVLLRALDETISQRFTELTSKTMDTRLGVTVTSAHQDADGITLGLSDGTSVTADAVLVAQGRTPNGDELQVEKAGIELDEAGRIRVNEYGETTAPGVWALGDISSPYQLKHVANHEGKVVKHNVLWDMGLLDDPQHTFSGMGRVDANGKQRMHHEYVPAGVFTHPQIATVGMTQAQAQQWAQEQGTEIAVKIQNYGDVAYGWAMEDQTGIEKLISDARSGLLLGAHLMGPQATTLIQQLVTAMEFGIRADDLATKQYWIHPALAEVTENALLGLQ